MGFALRTWSSWVLGRSNRNGTFSTPVTRRGTIGRCVVCTSVRTSAHLFTGVALGLVISPLSTGLYSTFFLSPLGFPTGMLGLVSTLFHGAPGYQFALWLGVVPPNEVVRGVGHVYIELLNGVFWAAIYGILGFIVDWARLVHSRRVS